MPRSRTWSPTPAPPWAPARLVLIAAENTLDALVTYLGALHAGHVPLLAPGDRLQHLDG